MGRASLPEERRREMVELAATRRAQGCPLEEIVAEIVELAGISALWAGGLAKGWRRSELLDRLRQQGDPSVDESMLWRWEIGERDPSKEHLDRLCQVYRTRPDLLGYGHDYSGRGEVSRTLRLDPRPLHAEPLAMGQAPLADMANHYRAVRLALGRRQRVAERRRLARVAARLGGHLGLLLWDEDEPVALAYFDASLVAAEEAGDPALGTWLAERRDGTAGAGR